MKKFICLLMLVFSLNGFQPAAAAEDLKALTKLEADYILACQSIKPGTAGHGAINNIFGDPTWVVPRENGLAILALIEAARILENNTYLSRAQLAANYLVSVQDPVDGSWFDQYSSSNPVLRSKSPTQTAEVMMAFYKLGYDHNRYPAMKKGAQFLMSLQNPANKKGRDDGLIGAGKNAVGQFETWRWASDNSFAYWALKMTEDWAVRENDTAFASAQADAARKIIAGIDTHLYVRNQNDPDFGVWRRAVDQNDTPVEVNFREWINYAPQMLDLPALGVGDPKVGTWIHNVLQKADGAVVWNTGNESQRKSPGFAFQAALAWLDLDQVGYADAARNWAAGSGLWQKTLDGNNAKGGWIDWAEPAVKADWWLRFIDTSFYAITAFAGGYHFGIVQPVPQFIRGDSNHDGAVDISDAQTTLGWLFLGTAAPVCQDAMDANDDGELDISDAVHTLYFLFVGTKTIPPPYPAAGIDPTLDDLGCVTGL